MDRQPIPAHARAVMQLGDHVHQAVHRLHQTEPCHRRLDDLAHQLCERGFRVTSHPAKFPLIDVTPCLIADTVDDALLAAITTTGHTIRQDTDCWHIHPPISAGEFALAFRLWTRP